MQLKGRTVSSAFGLSLGDPMQLKGRTMSSAFRLSLGDPMQLKGRTVSSAFGLSLGDPMQLKGPTVSSAFGLSLGDPMQLKGPTVTSAFGLSLGDPMQLKGRTVSSASVSLNVFLSASTFPSQQFPPLLKLLPNAKPARMTHSAYLTSCLPLFICSTCTRLPATKRVCLDPVRLPYVETCCPRTNSESYEESATTRRVFVVWPLDGLAHSSLPAKLHA